MPTTTTHQIYYPSGTSVPNVPVQDQTQAESVEAALNKITKAPLIICEKLEGQTTSSTATVRTDVIWQTEIHKQGITHAANSASFTVTEDGIYQINARVSFYGATVTGTIIANINGVDRNNTLTDQVGASTAFAKPAFTGYLKLVAGDVVKIRMQSSGVNTAITGAESSFQMSKVVVY
jgi:hypothetical protein